MILERGQVVTTIKLEHKLFTGLANRIYPMGNQGPAPPQVVQNGQVQPIELQQHNQPVQNNEEHPQHIITKNPYYTPPTTREPYTRPTQNKVPVTHHPVTPRTTYKQATKSYPTIGSREICGKQSVGTISLVVNGTASSRGDWPWLVAYFTNEKGNPAFICGGTLISEVNSL